MVCSHLKKMIAALKYKGLQGVMRLSQSRERTFDLSHPKTGHSRNILGLENFCIMYSYLSTTNDHH